MKDALAAHDRRALLSVSLLWSMTWFFVQAWLLYTKQHGVVSNLPVIENEWSRIADVSSIMLHVVGFIISQFLIYIIFAWVNFRSFCVVILKFSKLQRRSKFLALVAQLFVATLVIHLLNAWFYPNSITGDFLVLTLTQPVGRGVFVLLSMLLVIYFLLWICLELFVLRFGRMVSVFLVALLLVGWYWPIGSMRTKETHSFGKPNVVIIGIDSLRPDHLRTFGSPFSVTPNLDELLKDSVIFSDVLAAQAHTFPSTVSVLTGQYPSRNGARGNLFPPELVSLDYSIANDFKRNGYATVFSTDETRFSNIDEKYGFDKVIFPSIGLPDFIFGLISDNALTNLFANTKVGHWIFPDIYGNRALSYAYNPKSFSGLLEGNLSSLDSRPLFLYAHLCAGHWPYFPRSPYFQDAYSELLVDEYRDGNPSYIRGVAAADQQLGSLLNYLEKIGRLNNTILVVLSDHGEDFSMSKDSIFDDAGAEVTDKSNGHGGSAYRAPQVQVLMAFRRYGSEAFSPNLRLEPASLIDIAPTLVEILKISTLSDRFDGMDLSAYLQGGAQGASDRVRYVESSFLPKALNSAKIDERDVLKESVGMYAITGEGRVEVRTNWIDYQITHRQRAAYMGNWVVGLTENQYQDPIVINRKDRKWWAWSNAPTDSPKEALLADLCDHWKGDVSTLNNCQIKNINQ